MQMFQVITRFQLDFCLACPYISHIPENDMRYLLITLLILMAAGASWSRSIVFEDSTARTLISRTLEKTFLLKYEEALALVDTLEDYLPEHGISPLLRSGVLYCRMLDFEDELDMEEFESNYDAAWAGADKLDDGGETAEADLYKGVLLGYKALLKQRQGKWWPAVRIGIKASGYMKDCLAADSSYADALLGVGTYKYWSSRATDFINWLPLIPDQKEQGILLMRRAMEEGLFGCEISRSTLAWTLIDAGRPGEAVRLSLEGLALYPGSHHYLWSLAQGYFHLGRLKQAAGAYERLYTSINGKQRNNHYNEVGICKQMGRIFLGLNKPEQALIWIERGLSYPLDAKIEKRRAKTLKVLEELREEAKTRLRSN
jgi:tetratricopeptide (TPR) repeat protein